MKATATIQREVDVLERKTAEMSNVLYVKNRTHSLLYVAGVISVS